MLRGLDGFLIHVAWYNCAVLRVRRGLVSSVFGGHSEGETPLPFPNRVVKPLSADGTWPSRAWESRTLPVFIDKSRPQGGGSSSLGAGGQAGCEISKLTSTASGCAAFRAAMSCRRFVLSMMPS